MPKLLPLWVFVSPHSALLIVSKNIKQEHEEEDEEEEEHKQTSRDEGG